MEEFPTKVMGKILKPDRESQAQQGLGRAGQKHLNAVYPSIWLGQGQCTWAQGQKDKSGLEVSR